MSPFQIYSYAISALIPDLVTGKFTLSADIGHGDMHLVLTPSLGEVSEDTPEGTHRAVIAKPDGTIVVEGRIFGAITDAHNDGAAWLARIGASDADLGFISSQPLLPGRAYALDAWVEPEPCPGGQPERAAFRSIPCFGAGTMISTDVGEIPVDWLRPGDRVLTRDSGYQPVLWIGRFLPLTDITAGPLDVIQIAPDAFGPGLPAQRLCLTPGYHILLKGPVLDFHFGEAEMLVACKHLVGGNQIALSTESSDKTYYQILLPDHELILADGLWIESLFAEAKLLQTLPESIRNRVSRITFGKHKQKARACLKRYEMRVLDLAKVLAGDCPVEPAQPREHAA